MKKLFSTLILFSFIFNGCAFVQGLRDDLDDGKVDKSQFSNFDYASPENKKLPPPPTTVQDDRISSIAGTPVDLSGMRAKSGRVTKKEFLEEAKKNENSLWAEDGQNNYLFARNKMKTSGDLVTIKIEDELRKDMVMEVKKLLPPEYRDQEIRVPGLTRELASDVSSDKGGVASAVAKQAGDMDPTDSMTAEIIERYPNGNLRLRGVKRIQFKSKARNMEVTAIAKGLDIDDADTIRSSKFLEHKAELYK
jgi:flagellar L-ring protein precursor FlgH